MNPEAAGRIQDIIHRAYQNDWITDSEADYLDGQVENSIH